MKRFINIFHLIALLSTVTASPIDSTVNINCVIEQKTFNETENIPTCVLQDFTVENSTIIMNINGTTPEIKALFIKDVNSPHLPIGIANFLPSLEYFIYEYSKVGEINSIALKNFSNLLEISFHQNKLTQITSGTFSDNKLLRKISLDANSIKSIDSDVFKDLIHLREVYLNENELVTLSKNLFSHNPEIRVLNLEMNRITTLPVSIFHGLNHLHTLKLDYNELVELPDRILKDNRNLRIFTASFNKIERIGAQNVEIFRNCTEVNLLKNECTKDLYRGHDFEELKEIIETDCKVTCEEQNTWLTTELEENKRNKRSTGNFEDIEEKILERLKKSGIFEIKTEISSLKYTLNETVKDLQIKMAVQEESSNNKFADYVNSSELNDLKTECKKLSTLLELQTEKTKTLQDEFKSQTENLGREIENLKKNVTEGSTNFEEISNRLKIFIKNVEKIEKDLEVLKSNSKPNEPKNAVSEVPTSTTQKNQTSTDDRSKNASATDLNQNIKNNEPKNADSENINSTTQENQPSKDNLEPKENKNASTTETDSNAGLKNEDANKEMQPNENPENA